MVEQNFHKLIRWFVIAVLIISVFVPGDLFNYGVALALIYLLLRTPMKYTK